MKDFIMKNFKIVKSFLFIFGFVIDWFTLPKVSSPFYVWIGPLYLLLILFLYKSKNVFNFLYIKNRLYNKNLFPLYFRHIHKYTPFIISFFLGSFLSYVLVYYFKSTEIFISWPLIIIIVISMLLNEFLGNKISDTIIYLIAVTFYFIFNIPIFYNRVDDTSFLISLLVSLLFALFFMKFIGVGDRKEKIISISFIFIFQSLLVLFYFTNNMPAVPLFLKEKSFHSNIEKKGDVYDKYKIFPGSEFIYFYSSIVSPLKVEANITHIWYKFNNEEDVWRKISTIDFPIIGGREDGYRGFTYISSRGEGKYKVVVKAGERIIGQKEISIK